MKITRFPLETHFANEFCKYQVAEKTVEGIQKHSKPVLPTLVR